MAKEMLTQNLAPVDFEPVNFDAENEEELLEATEEEIDEEEIDENEEIEEEIDEDEETDEDEEDVTSDADEDTKEEDEISSIFTIDTPADMAHITGEEHCYEYLGNYMWIFDGNKDLMDKDDLKDVHYLGKYVGKDTFERNTDYTEKKMLMLGYYKRDAGYYDENKDFYKNIGLVNMKTPFLCSNCGNVSVRLWKEEYEGSIIPFSCEKCGKPYKIDIIDNYKKTYRDVLVMIGKGVRLITKKIAHKFGKVFKVIFIDLAPCIIGVGVIVGIVGAMIWGAVKIVDIVGDGYTGAQKAIQEAVQSDYYTGLNNLTITWDENVKRLDVTATVDEVKANHLNLPSTLYMRELGGRNAYYKIGEDGKGYYQVWVDGRECRFWHNENLSPARWQYWFEGISDYYMFKGYGTMEYNNGEWSIEVADGVWGTVEGEMPDYTFYINSIQKGNTVTFGYGF